MRLYFLDNLQRHNDNSFFIVDQLIRNLGDPRVAEKLRIYRLVEEQFALVESQVQKEVGCIFSQYYTKCK